MADIYSKTKRSEVMATVKSSNTKPELLVRKFLFSKGFRYRLHLKCLEGKPDIVLKKYKSVIFINGCFWHGHLSCKNSSLPKTNQKYWQEKIDKNIARDEKTVKTLKELGWNVIIIWECDLKGKMKACVLEKLVAQLEALRIIQGSNKNEKS